MTIKALDTNIVSYALKNVTEVRKRLEKELADGCGIVVSPITFYEIMRGLYVNNSGRKLETFNRLFIPFVQDMMSHDDWLQSAELYAFCVKTGHPMAENDLFQAAFCLRHGYTLVTNNTTHFKHILNLQHENWME
ncbi:MAG: type II toxin-antitoxin system VapC family toxin [Treponematales bacterium]